MNTNKNSLTLVAISEAELPKFNKIWDTYVLYKSIISNDIQIGLMDNYLSYFAPSLTNISYLEYADSKAYFYDPNSYYKGIDNEDRSIYEIVPSKNKTVSSYSIINGNEPLDSFIDNASSIDQVSLKNKYIVK